MSKEVLELQEALEYQVDVVLRLEDERLLLQKENNLQKQCGYLNLREKLKELNTMLQKYLGQQFLQIEKHTQTELQERQHFEVQTQEDEIISDYSLSNSTVSVVNQTSLSQQQGQSNSSKLLDQAKSLVKQSASRLPVKKLKFCGDNYKENKDKDNQEKKETKPTNTKQVDSQSEALTREIVNLTKQLQQLKLQQRSSQETIKKYEKETGEVVKLLEVKNEMLNKLRNENAEMAIIINQDKFKSVRQLDLELKKERDDKVKYQAMASQKTEENQRLVEELKQFREVLSKLTDEFERYRNTHNQSNISQSKIEPVDTSFYQEEIKIKVSTINELKLQNDQLQEEVDYFRNLSLQQKKITEKQEEDLDFYREILIKHKIIKQ
ncbi:unnamed protein product (macronuclear) [Paramecium tetraurelia]|uniref:Uncharacterized protein n=1 Tax=Paramecium tetraurelia TaxID=5888 RepID=A0DGG5_PARTE|nr:uncharacterized protein GSPATT00002261001 [Paramecium tetraurelia]CAK82132.1 unnamed protein product [Paramecium tetraurelia]|eukprot:XP_001449529.1 hypothetical protein (macronuclear) [Paramecium tetraurelia strain d4-2]